MSEPARFRVEVEVTGTGISGWVTDPSGMTHRFDGWLGLMALLTPGSRAEEVHAVRER